MTIGDTVEWTHVSGGRNAVVMILRSGEITAIDGEMATVQKPSGRTEEVALVRLHAPGASSQLGQFVQTLREGSRT